MIMCTAIKLAVLTLTLTCIANSFGQSSAKNWIYKNKYLGERKGYSWVFHDHTVYSRSDHLGDIIVAGVAAENKGLFRLKNPGNAGDEWVLEPLKIDEGEEASWRATEGHVDSDQIKDLIARRGVQGESQLVWFKGPDLIYQGEIQTEGEVALGPVAMGDIDGDGDEDFVVASGGRTVTIHWWRNEGLDTAWQANLVGQTLNLFRNDSDEFDAYTKLFLTDADGDGNLDVEFANSDGVTRSLTTLFAQADNGKDFVRSETKSNAIPKHESLHGSQWVAEGLIDADEHWDSLYISPGIPDGDLDNDVKWSRHDGVDRGLLYVKKAEETD